MLRTILLIFQNEFRLMARDRVGLFMLLLAPVVIISVAGFSLGDVYGSHPNDEPYLLPVVDQDHGELANALIHALTQESALTISRVDSLDQARAMVLERDRAPLAIVIPKDATAQLAKGQNPSLIFYVDPLKRIEVDAIENRFNSICHGLTTMNLAVVRQRIDQMNQALNAYLDRVQTTLKQFQAQSQSFSAKAARGQAAAQQALKAAMAQRLREMEAQTQAAIDQSVAETRAALGREAAARQSALTAVSQYLVQLRASERAFDRWLAKLKTLAGSRSADIPPPPAWPTPPPAEQLAELSKPLDFQVTKPVLPKFVAPAIALKPVGALPPALSPAALDQLSAAAPRGAMPALPGSLVWRETALTGGKTTVSAFDQYVPGFGITFLLVGMLLGLSLGLIDDRDWGTLQRLQISGAPLAGTLIGKLLSRFLIGLLQLIILFAVGWLVFGTSLGPNPLALLLPATAIAFAAATFGLVIACVARTHDSVMPIGATAAMAMSAMGGCWWPIDFEPAWMRALAHWLPTTWTMQAFNDLMVRGLSARSVLWPAAATVGLGAIYLVAGIIGAYRLYE
jgi:ABC-type multidrug transport system permease subunit